MLASSLAPVLVNARPAASTKRPNIVFVLTDDLRYDGLGCTGHPFARTPHLDRIAREGANFGKFFTAVPLCSPSRATFLTGQYPHAHRIINNDKHGLSETSYSLVTFPRILREAGYESAYIGKWHMGFDDARRPGFDHWVSFRAQGLFIDPVVIIDDRREQLTGYMTDFLNERAVRFIEKKRKKPFVLVLAHKAVHYPYLPAARHEKLYEDARYTPPAPVPGDMEGKPAMRRNLPQPDVLRIEDASPEPQESRRGRPETPDAVVRDQARCMSSIDEGMGMIFNALAKTGQLDDTIVIFTSDNGYLMGEHGQFNQKRWAYEESIQIPFLMRYPRMIRPGTRIDRMCVSVDLAPTLFDAAGVTSYAKVHGRSFVPLLRDPKSPWRESILTEHFVEKVVPNVPDWQSVRTERWKYIHYPTLDGMDELYDLAADPREVRNLISDPACTNSLNQLKSELARLLKETPTPRQGG
jgi:N-acetylglucosamine-6-sulfatase